MKKITDTKDLPEWFSIENYRDCYEFGPILWCLNLMLRRQYYIDPLKNETTLLTEYWIDKEIYMNLWNTPLFGNDIDILEKEFGSSITSLGIHEAYNIYKHFDDDRRLREKAEKESYISSDADSLDADELSARKRLNVAYSPTQGEKLPRKFLAQIDFNATDTQLVSDFKTWLLNTRELYAYNSKRTKQFSRSDFASWASNQILAYLDLTAWASFNQVSISNHTMGSAIIPDDYGDKTSKVRNTIRTKAMELMDEDILNLLRAQIG